MKKNIFLIALGFAISCSTPPPVAPVVEAPKQETKKVEAPPPPAPPAREIGSLWSEESRWNSFYSSNATRSVGDVVFIKPSDNLRMLMAGKVEKVNSAGDTNVSAPHETPVFLVSIREVLPEGVYNVHGEQKIKVRGREQQVMIQGKIRERDISADDSASSEYLFDMNLEIHGQDADSEKAPAKDVKPQKDSSAKEKNKESQQADSDSDKQSKVSTASK